MKCARHCPVEIAVFRCRFMLTPSQINIDGPVCAEFKRPTLVAAKKLVDLLTSLKYNQLQLYIEHTFAYQHHKEVWEKADPFTGAEILSLDAYCRARFIELVPNQNSCGHLHKFLIHKRYEGLAECPEGVDFGPRPSGPRDAPFSLCPTDARSLDFVSGLYRELLPHFPSSTYVNAHARSIAAY